MKTLDTLRLEIDTIDIQLLNLLAKRFQISKKIGNLKEQDNIQTIDAGREDEILQKLTSIGKQQNISETVIRKFWDVIFKESYKSQE